MTSAGETDLWRLASSSCSARPPPGHTSVSRRVEQAVTDVHFARPRGLLSSTVASSGTIAPTGQGAASARYKGSVSLLASLPHWARYGPVGRIGSYYDAPEFPSASQIGATAR